MLEGVAICGRGCVTPLGMSPDDVAEKIISGEYASPVDVEVGGTMVPVMRVPVPQDLARANPRLRRSSAISIFACEAARAAVEEAGIPDGARTAIFFAASNGAVIYTRKFYDGVIASGTGSPLLFPETVYNAPASHVAALLGWDGEVCTLVSDAAVGLDALRCASESLVAGAVDYALVVAAEEWDPVLAEAYYQWGLVRSSGKRGAVLSEGSVALVLGRSGGTAVEAVHPGLSFHNRFSARAAAAAIYEELAPGCDAVVTSDSDARGCLDFAREGIRSLAPKRACGEAFGTSTLLQVMVADFLIRSHRSTRAAVVTTGWNGQAGGLVLTRRGMDG